MFLEGFCPESKQWRGLFIFSDEFYCDLHEMVDRSPTKLIQSVSLFYVRDGQKTASEILENAVCYCNLASSDSSSTS